MKIRIQGDSIRLRLTRPEVERLLRGERVVEATHLPGATLWFELRSTAVAGGPIDAWFAGNRLTIAIDADVAAAWAEPDHVGFAHDVPVAGRRTLAVLIEKDFACLDRAGAEPDAFPNPKTCASLAAASA